MLTLKSEKFMAKNPEELRKSIKFSKEVLSTLYVDAKRFKGRPEELLIRHDIDVYERLLKNLSAQYKGKEDES